MKVDQAFRPSVDIARKNKAHCRRWLRRILIASGIFLLGFGGGYLVVANLQALRDQITAWQNPLQSAVASLADQVGLNARGRFLLQVSRAQIDGRSAFNKHCTNNDESQSIVLGCYTGRIYVFDVTDSSVSAIKSVIAAHEMLHAAYARLSSAEKTKIDNEIRAYIPKVQNADIEKSLAVYAKTEPGEELNELHSLLGTEEKNLPTDLENYYKTYFANRTKVVVAYDKYAAVFANLQSEESELSQQLTSLKSEIKSMASQYETDSQALSDDIANFNTCANQWGCFTRANFDTQHAALSARQQTLVATETTINAKIDKYNQLVDQLNALGVEAQKLDRNLDSRVTTLQ